MRHLFLSLVDFLKSLLGMNKEVDMYLPVYTAIMKQARKPVLYGPQGANDDFDGRFEILVMHIYLVLRRLKADGQGRHGACLLYTSPSPRDRTRSRMPSSA